MLVSTLSIASLHPVWAASISCGNTITSNTVLTADLLNCPFNGIVIGASGITLDCQNHTIAGSGSSGSNGILSQGQANIAIRNCVVRGFFLGINWMRTNQSQLVNNNVNHNVFGYVLNGCNFNSLINNTSTNNSGRSFSQGFHLGASQSNTLMFNSASGDPVGFLFLRASQNLLSQNTATNTSFAYIIHSFSDNNTLTHNTARNTIFNAYSVSNSSNFNTLTDNTSDGANNGFVVENSSQHNLLTENNSTSSLGFAIVSSNFNIFSNNTALNQRGPIEVGFGVFNASYNTLSHNSALNATSQAGRCICSGFFLLGLGRATSPSFNVFSDNLSEDNGVDGFSMVSATSNSFDHNTVQNNLRSGFEIFNASNSNTFTRNLVNGNALAGFAEVHFNANNTLTSNIVEGNSIGVFSDNSTSRSLIYNNVFNNRVNAEDNGTSTWNIAKTPGTNIVRGPFLGGNFWSDYKGTDLDSDGLGDTLLPYNSNGLIVNGGDFLPLVVSHLHLSEFFTDPTLSPLPLDSKGNPSVVVLLARGLVRSTSPGQVLAWINVTNTGSTPLQSLNLNETLPVDWAVNPAWMPAVGAIHVFYANATSLANETDITQPSTITVSTGNPETVHLAIANITATGIGHPLMPGQSILLSVKLTYALIGTSQSPSNYPRNYTDTATAAAWTQPSFTGSKFTGTASAFFTADAKVVS